MYVCQKEACQVQSAPPDIDTGSSVGTAFPVKVIFPDFLTYPAIWQHESDAQAVVHRQSCTGLFTPFLSCSADKVGLMGSIRAFIKSAVPFLGDGGGVGWR